MAGVSFSVKLEGLEVVQARLMATQAALEPPLITESLARGAAIFVERAQALAPVGPPGYNKDHSAGHLKQSITAMPDGIGFVIGPHGVNYAKVQEEGKTISANNGYMIFDAGSGVRRAKQVTIPPHPYMAPAFAEGVAPAVAAVEAAVALQIRR